MSRPTKAGLDYFPLDVDMDDQVELLEAKHGISGFGVLIKLFQVIYKTGYYARMDEDRLLLLSKRIDVDINSINAVINDCLRWKLFAKTLFDQFQILTSRGIQKRYIEASKRRKDVDFIKEYLLLHDIEERYPEKVNVNINSINVDINLEADSNIVNINEAKTVNVDINPVNVDINPQSKVKESKEKNNNTPEQPPNPTDQKSSQPVSKNTPSGASFNPVFDKEKITGHDEYFREINKACDLILNLPKKAKTFNPQKWAQISINKKRHPGAVAETLHGLEIFWDTADDPWAICESIIKTKNGNWNEKEAIAIHAELKAMKPGNLEFFTNGLIRRID